MMWNLWHQGWPVFIKKGGPGSGNWGHAGRPGKHGGSAPGGGLAKIGAKPDSTPGERRRLADEKRKGLKWGGNIGEGWKFNGKSYRKTVGDRTSAIQQTSWGSPRVIFGTGLLAEERTYKTLSDAVERAERYLAHQWIGW